MQGSKGNGREFPKWMVPSARDGVICGRRPRQRQLAKMERAAEFCGSSEKRILQNVTRHSEPWGLRRSTVSLQPCSANLSHMLVKLGHVALDGTKVKANASKHKSMSYQRMQEKEAQLAAEVAELLRRAQAADDDEDRRYGKDQRGDELPEELAFREGRLEKLREAMAALEAEAQVAAERAEAEGRKHPGVPDDKAQRNFTDAESRIMPAAGGKDFLPAYNCQAVVDSAHQVIVAARATNQTTDKQQAAAMLQETIDNVGAVPREVSADAGYYSAQAVDELSALGVDPFVAPEKTRHGHKPPPAPRGRIPKELSPRDRMRRKLQTKRGRQRYALRMGTVEPVFGQIKQGRGFRQFLLRGLEQVDGEWSLICTGHNLLKLFRFGANQPRETRINSIVRCIRNIAEVVSPMMHAKLLIRHRLQTANHSPPKRVTGCIWFIWCLPPPTPDAGMCSVSDGLIVPQSHPWVSGGRHDCCVDDCFPAASAHRPNRELAAGRN